MGGVVLVARACIAALAAAMVGCASLAHEPPSRPSVADMKAPEPGDTPDVVTVNRPPSADLHLSVGGLTRSRVAASGAMLLEESSTELSAAIARNATRPTAELEVLVAQAYMSHGVLDKASEHFAAAARLDPREGAAWDGLARVWRDWGFPQIGLGDAYRAVSASPDSPAVRNTLGTVLQSLGQNAAARVHFARASALDRRAAYALNNLCYSWLVEANAETAAVECARALEIDPNLTVARWNLALARTMAAQRTEKGRHP